MLLSLTNILLARSKKNISDTEPKKICVKVCWDIKMHRHKLKTSGLIYALQLEGFSDPWNIGNTLYSELDSNHVLRLALVLLKSVHPQAVLEVEVPGYCLLVECQPTPICRRMQASDTISGYAVKTYIVVDSETDMQKLDFTPLQTWGWWQQQWNTVCRTDVVVEEVNTLQDDVLTLVTRRGYVAGGHPCPHQIFIGYVPRDQPSLDPARLSFTVFHQGDPVESRALHEAWWTVFTNNASLIGYKRIDSADISPYSFSGLSTQFAMEPLFEKVHMMEYLVIGLNLLSVWSDCWAVDLAVCVFNALLSAKESDTTDLLMSRHGFRRRHLQAVQVPELTSALSYIIDNLSDPAIKTFVLDLMQGRFQEMSLETEKPLQGQLKSDLEMWLHYEVFKLTTESVRIQDVQGDDKGESKASESEMTGSDTSLGLESASSSPEPRKRHRATSPPAFPGLMDVYDDFRSRKV